MTRPADLRRCASDAEFAAAVAAAPDDEFGVTGGDLHRALGSPPDRTDMHRLPIDAMIVTVDDVRHHAVAHVIARGRTWWRGEILAVMNVDHVGDWNVAPRAHPNDGRLDVVIVDASMSVRERWQARSRLAAGTHVPHPRITVRTATAVDETFKHPRRVLIDGVTVGAACRLRVDILPDAHTVLA